MVVDMIANAKKKSYHDWSFVHVIDSTTIADDLEFDILTVYSFLPYVKKDRSKPVFKLIAN